MENEISFEQEKLYKTRVSILASKEKRMINFLVDTLVCLSIMVILIGIGANLESDGYINPILKFIIILCAITGWFFYYAIMEKIYGKTLGKIISKTKVVRRNGEKIRTKDVIIRTIIRMITLDGLSFFGKYLIGFHDRFSSTLVVNDFVDHSDVVEGKFDSV